MGSLDSSITPCYLYFVPTYVYVVVDIEMSLNPIVQQNSKTSHFKFQCTFSYIQFCNTFSSAVEGGEKGRERESMVSSERLSRR